MPANRHVQQTAIEPARRPAPNNARECRDGGQLKYSWFIFGCNGAGAEIPGDDTTAIDVLFGYTGRDWDKDADLQYNRARWYDPTLGRWMSPDPIGFGGGDANLYRYVGNHPTSARDPSGLAEPTSNRGLSRWDKFMNGVYGAIGGVSGDTTDQSINLTSGAGDAFSFGLSSVVRHYNPLVQDRIDYNSGTYEAGGWIGFGADLLIGPGEAKLLQGGAKGAIGAAERSAAKGVAGEVASKTAAEGAENAARVIAESATNTGLIVRQGNVVVEAGAEVSASEAHVGRVFANHGYDVTHKVTASARGIQGMRTAHLVVNGVGRVDVLTPKAINSTSIARAVESKGSQTPVVAVSGNISSRIMHETALRTWGKTTESAKAIQQIVFENNGVLTWFTRPLQYENDRCQNFDVDAITLSTCLQYLAQMSSS